MCNTRMPGAHGGQRRASNAPALELGINPESPGRTASVSNHWVPSLDPFYFNNNNDNNNRSLLLVHEDNVVDLVLLFYLIVNSVGWTQLTRLVHTASPLSAEPSHGSHSGFWYRIWHKPQVDLEFTIPPCLWLLRSQAYTTTSRYLGYFFKTDITHWSKRNLTKVRPRT